MTQSTKCPHGVVRTDTTICPECENRSRCECGEFHGCLNPPLTTPPKPEDWAKEYDLRWPYTDGNVTHIKAFIYLLLERERAVAKKEALEAIRDEVEEQQRALLDESEWARDFHMQNLALIGVLSSIRKHLNP